MIVVVFVSVLSRISGRFFLIGPPVYWSFSYSYFRPLLLIGPPGLLELLVFFFGHRSRLSCPSAFASPRFVGPPP
jgi:hypothetical protein